MNVLYYTTPSGNSPVRRFIEKLPHNVEEDCFSALDRLAQGDRLSMPLSRPLFNIALGLHELRFRSAPNIYRVFYYIQSIDAIYIVHATQKKTQKLPNKDRQVILKRIKEI